MPKTIEAHYPGKCPGCGEWIEEGDSLTIIDGDWVCNNCVEEAGDTVEHS